MAEGLFVTVVGGKHYTDEVVLRVGKIIRLVKDHQNQYDDEAIAVELPVIGKVGYVANSTRTVARGTLSAGRMYDLFEEECFGIVRFVLKQEAIIQLIVSHEQLFSAQDISVESLFSSE